MAQAISNLMKPNSGVQQTPMSPFGMPPAQMALNNAQSGIRSAPLLPPTNQHVESHTVNHPDGTSIVQTYHKPAKQKAGLVNPKQIGQAPEVKFINGQHHVPFRKSDGSVGFINANGEIH